MRDEIPATKRERTRLAKADLLMHLAITVEKWAEGCEGTDPTVMPFEQWSSDDPLVKMARQYDLSGKDLARLLRQIAQAAETRSVRAGFEDVQDYEEGRS